MKSWKKRLFVLNTDGLAYFKTEQVGRKRGRGREREGEGEGRGRERERERERGGERERERERDHTISSFYFPAYSNNTTGEN